MLGLPPAPAAAGFRVLTAPILFLAVWQDLKRMKLPNVLCAAVLAVYVVAGPFVLPIDVWLWRWINLGVVLAVGFVLFAVANVGAGDVKMAAAMAPFVAAGDAAAVMQLFAAFLLAAFFSHRALRAIPAVRRLAPDWVSWTRRDFPMGLAIVGTFAAYLGLVWAGLLSG